MDLNWIETNGKNYMGNGHTICILVNPSLISSCPPDQDYNKARSCSIYTVCEVKWEDGKIIELDQKVIDKASQEYNKESKIDIQRFILNSFEDGNPKFIGLNKTDIQERLIITI